ncbi:hypothetical protein AB0F18_06720 [Streptomyces sp. NPDC029216]|uniref:hypothetical protein n=1 Tax=Streptomyces sp. NPDC029216 TaxID=3154701 RepID=UPI0033E652FE
MAGRAGTWWRAIWRTVLALGVPPLAAALAFGVAREWAYGSLNGWLTFLAGLLLPLLLLGGHAALAGSRGALLVALSAVPAGVGVFLTLSAVDAGVLADRGVEVDCVVLEVTKHTKTDSSMDANGHWTTSTTTSYDHRLSCPAGPTDHMEAGSRLAKEGETLALVYDPRGKAITELARDLHPRGMRTAAEVAVGAAVLLGLAGAVREAREELRRRRWRAGRW